VSRRLKVHLTHDSLPRRRVFPASRLHWYWTDKLAKDTALHHMNFMAIAVVLKMTCSMQACINVCYQIWQKWYFWLLLAFSEQILS